MGIPTIFITFIIFIVVFRFKMHKNLEINKKVQDNFWTKETDSHFVRKQIIDSCDFLKAHPEVIPNYNEDFYKIHHKPGLYRSQVQCHSLACQPLMDLSHMLNSDVRLKYGTSMLSEIETYENNYSSYIQHLSILGNGLSELTLYEDAKKLLEEAIHLGTDASHIWINLGKIYEVLQDSEALTLLIDQSIALESLMKHKITTALKEIQLNL